MTKITRYQLKLKLVCIAVSIGAMYLAHVGLHGGGNRGGGGEDSSIQVIPLEKPD